MGSEVLFKQLQLTFSFRNKFIILPCGLLVDKNTFSKMYIFKILTSYTDYVNTSCAILQQNPLPSSLFTHVVCLCRTTRCTRCKSKVSGQEKDNSCTLTVVTGQRCNLYSSPLRRLFTRPSTALHSHFVMLSSIAVTQTETLSYLEIFVPLREFLFGNWKTLERKFLPSLA